MTVDQLDNVNLPHSGVFGRVEYLGNREGLGGSTSYDRLEGGFLRSARRSAAGPVWRRSEGADSLGSTIPFYDQFDLGGLFRLSGRPTGQLVGESYALGALLLYYRLTAGSGLVLKNMSLGVSAEVGKRLAQQYR